MGDSYQRKKSLKELEMFTLGKTSEEHVSYLLINKGLPSKKKN